MRKQLCSALIASAALIMLAIPPSWAAHDGFTPPGHGGTPPGHSKVPEINVGAGGAGLTVLAIALLLAREKRSRSS